MVPYIPVAKGLYGKLGKALTDPGALRRGFFWNNFRKMGRRWIGIPKDSRYCRKFSQ